MTSDDTELTELIKGLAKRHQVPDVLRQRIDISLAAMDLPPPLPMYAVEKQSWKRWFQLGTAFAFGVLLSLGSTTYLLNGMNDANRVEDEVFSSHIRSLMPGHSFDVASSDQHTVKPWFNGRLDFSPPVSDLAGEGFPLAGGRLDYVNHRTVAALVYHRRLHGIDVYIWPAQGNADIVSSFKSRQGFNAYIWVDAGMQYWAISDIPVVELQTFVQLLRRTNSEQAVN